MSKFNSKPRWAGTQFELAPQSKSVRYRRGEDIRDLFSLILNGSLVTEFPGRTRLNPEKIIPEKNLLLFLIPTDGMIKDERLIIFAQARPL